VNYAEYVIPAYVVVFGAIAAFTAVLVARGRRLGRDVADEDKPWT
jgi:heme exporter protein CcmD